MFDHFSSDKKRVNVKDFGAVGDGATNDTAAIVAAADSLTEGGVVYIPAGVYLIDFIPFREGVGYLLEGKPDDVSAGYTKELQDRVAAGEFAVIRSTGAGDMFINHEKGAFADTAVSNYGISGGVLDSIGKVRTLLFVHSHNVLLENCILLDARNDHTLQITGSEDVLVRNCIFAGYNFRGNLYAETIQIEHSHSGALGVAHLATSNIPYGEYRFSKNVTIDGCYFGKSDKFGAPLVPIGHHGHAYKSSVQGCVIKNCVFDNPLHMALRSYAYSDFVVENNTFIATEPKVIDSADAMITFLLSKPTCKGISTDDEGHYFHATYEPPFAAEGSIGTKIRNNKFIIKGDRIPRLVNATGQFKRGMQAISYLIKIDEFMGKHRVFNGYLTVKNMLSDMEITDNEVCILDRRPAVNDHLIYIEKANGVKISGNKIESGIDSYLCWYRGNEAVRLVDCAVENDDRTMYIECDRASGRRVILPLGNGETANVFCPSKLLIKLYTDENGRIETATDENGNGIITVVAEEGYTFDGWDVLTEGVTLTAGDMELCNSIELIARYK